MQFDPGRAEHRFGYGRSPVVAPPASLDDMLSGLTAPDVAAENFPLPDWAHFQSALAHRRRFLQFARQNRGTEKGKEARETAQRALREARRDQAKWFVQTQLRRITTPQAFRERLVAFWADHFTALGKNPILRLATPAYIEEAIRPHIAGSFADLLRAAITHPLMLQALDQYTSMGPNSVAAKRREDGRGLNENLAREVLELHTLGVNGPYSQTDVTELAKLFTGLSTTREMSFHFRPNLAEPGSERVLGRTYGPERSLEPINAALNDIALHPATAAHIARKLVVHFVSDQPPTALVAQVTEAYETSGGDLLACYQALLGHPAAWQLDAPNIRPPDEFISAALRALGIAPDRLIPFSPRAVRDLFFRPQALMGQPWLRPSGPDGFAEEDAAWVTPQGISARLDWAMNAPARLLEEMPEPEAMLAQTLGKAPPAKLIFAVKNAENRRIALGLILASPAFQRR